MPHPRGQRRQRATARGELPSAPAPSALTHLTTILPPARQLFPTTDAWGGTRLCKSIPLQKQFSLCACGVRLENVPREGRRGQKMNFIFFLNHLLCLQIFPSTHDCVMGETKGRGFSAVDCQFKAGEHQKCFCTIRGLLLRCPQHSSVMEV